MTRSNRREDEVKEAVQEYWDSRSESFDDDRQHGIHDAEQRGAWLSVLRRWTGDPPLQILDVGCGTGVVSLLLAELGHDVTGIDFSPEMLAHARKKAQDDDCSVDFCAGDAEDLEFADDTFDLVTTRHLIWTLPNPSKAIREWSRVVEPGGRIVLIEGYWDFPEPWDVYRDIHDDLPLYHGRPAEDLAEFLTRQGVERIEHEFLRDPVLWGETLDYEMYIMAGDVPR